ncbi:MAG TPA: type IV pilus twitching motility protein PilT, partial [Solirubrobacterales bacterium]|nr:type IV pilus twitching motility protein PilT [Solirubrobacterales bacterium]
MDFDFADVLTEMVRRGASDMHLSSGFAPAIRLQGRVIPLEGYDRLTPQETRDLIYSILNDDQRKHFENNLQLDFAYSIPGVARFRVNCFFQRGSISSAFRLVPHEIPTLESLAVPSVLHDFTMRPRGFVLVTGPTGSGKSTTLAAMIDAINASRNEHILTIEDPIEFLHSHKSCIVNQREVGSDAPDFGSALRAGLRQDPDVILVGEMRDLETISTALTAAETGHLVFATLHTQSASQTVDRVIDVFPPSQQQQVRMQLSVALQGIVTQQLLPTVDGAGRVVASEVLVPSPAIRNLIREGKTHQIYSAIQTSGASGMQTMDSDLARLVRGGRITHKLAEQRAAVPEELRRLLGDGGMDGGAAPAPSYGGASGAAPAPTYGGAPAAPAAPGGAPNQQGAPAAPNYGGSGA